MPKLKHKKINKSMVSYVKPFFVWPPVWRYAMIAGFGLLCLSIGWFAVVSAKAVSFEPIKIFSYYYRGELKQIDSEKMARVSWYGPKFHLLTMANGEIFNQNDPNIVAHRSLPFETKVRLTNPKTNQSIVVTVKDRGPYTRKNGRYDREFDLSKAANQALGKVGVGVVEAEILELGPIWDMDLPPHMAKK